jgi:hypothetical protein
VKGLTRSGRRSSAALDGPAWILVWLLALLLVRGVVAAAPVWAQTPDDEVRDQEAGVEPGSQLGGQLYPPTGYPTDPHDGIVPVSQYDIGCSNGGFLGNIPCLTVGTATNLVFSLGKLLVAVAIWLLEAATGFVLEASLTDAATSVADILDGRVLGPMRLSHLGLVVSALYMGWQFLRGRVGLGAGEFGLTLVVLAVLLHVSTGPGFGGAVTATMQATGSISAEIVSLAADADGQTGAADKVKRALMASFVRDPYDTINWGRLLEGTACEPARNEALASGPHGFGDQPRWMMEAAGCQAEAAFNADATVARLVGAVLYLVVAVAALIMLLVTAFTLVVAKGMALFLIALLPIALYAGVFPGAGRSLLWHWVAALVRVVGLIIAMGVFLALLVSGLTGLLGLTRGLWERFLLVIFFMAVMWVGRRQLVDISSRFADSTLQRLDTARVGGAHGATWIRPYQADGLTGLGVTHTIRESMADIPRPHHRQPAPSGAVGWRRRRTS